MRKKSWKSLGTTLFIVLLAMLSASKGQTSGFFDTSSTDYCLSCHEMKRYQDELKASSHAKDAQKKDIGCSQCHIPPSGLRYLSIKLIFGAKDLYAHYFGETNDLDRLKLQQFTRRFIPDENCIACHKDLTKNVKNEPLSPLGKLAHDAYLDVKGEKSGNTRSNCAGCHQNMAHLPKFDKRYEANAKFAAKLDAQEETSK